MSQDINLKSDEFRAILSRIETIEQDSKYAILQHATEVQKQLDAIAKVPHETRASCALSFALLSAQAEFVPNVAATPILLKCLRNNATRETFEDSCRNVRYFMVGSKYDYANRSRQLILNALPHDMTLKNVKKFTGFGYKTASMACALYNEHSRVMTLDTWMLNGLLGTANTGGEQNAIGYTAADSAYRVIAELLLGIADELEVSPFLLQWSLWSLYRGKSVDNHLPIFGL